jgi:acetyltransferase
MINNLKYIFSAEKVAVIGASTKPDSVGRAIFANILFSGFTGIVYPVNPKAKSILGVKTYPSICDITDKIDLAIIIVPSTEVAKVLTDCGECGVRSVVVISAGFKEVGENGANLENKLKEILTKYNMALIGPNCLGIINADPDVSLNATFAKGMPKAGNISFISQSGALGVAALEYARAEGIGLSKFVSVGNKAHITENELLKVLADDPNTNVILLYLEDLVDHKCFIELAREITSEKGKPILAIKSGRTREGAKAASSHTGALSGSDETYDSLFTQCGIIRVETIEELFDYATCFANQPILTGNNIAVITNAGGPGIMAVDACVRYGLNVTTLSDKTREILKKGLPPTANINNPVDLIGDAKEDRYELAIKAVLADENVNGLIVICTPQMMTNLKGMAQIIINISKNYKKPVVACFMATSDIEEPLAILESGKIPHYRFPEASARALAHVWKYASWVHRPRTKEIIFSDVKPNIVKEIILNAKREKRTFLPEPEGQEILKAYGFPVCPSVFAKNEKECRDAANKIGYPICLKIVSPTIIHKVDVKGVKLNITNEKDLINAYNTMLKTVKDLKPDSEIWGVLVQKMLSGGKETIIGARRDKHFGTILMFGLGGIYVEIFKDVSFRIAPIRELSAYRMIEEIKGYKIFQGFRGEKPSDIDAIAQCLERLSQLCIEHEEIEEIDINPLMVFEKGQGAQIVDVRILVNN